MFTLHIMIDVGDFEDATKLQNDIINLCKPNNLTVNSGIYEVRKYPNYEVTASNDLITIGPPDEYNDV